MSVQVCEGVFRQKCGRYVAVIPCERREGGQSWTDGIIHYFDDGTVTFAEGGSVVDLVEYIGPFPVSQQATDNDRLKAEIERLKVELRGYAAESHRQLRTLQASHEKLTDRLQAEQSGQREGFRIAISMILEALK